MWASFSRPLTNLDFAVKARRFLCPSSSATLLHSKSPCMTIRSSVAFLALASQMHTTRTGTLQWAARSFSISTHLRTRSSLGNGATRSCNFAQHACSLRTSHPSRSCRRSMHP